MKYKLGLDIDGVIFALYRDQFLGIMNERHNTDRTMADLVNYSFHELWDCKDGEIYEVFTLTDDHKVGLVDPNCIKYMNKLLSDDHFIELVTSHVPHHERGHEPLLERLLELKVPYHSIRFTGSGTALGNKREAAADYDFMLDDSVKHLNEMVGETNPVKYIREWNMNAKSDKWLDVNNWKEFYHLINTCSKLEIKGIMGKAMMMEQINE